MLIHNQNAISQNLRKTFWSTIGELVLCHIKLLDFKDTIKFEGNNSWHS